MKNAIEIAAAIVTIIGFVVILIQLRLQKKKDRTELILRLSSEFFNNTKYMSVFKILDSDKLVDCNASIRKIIAGGEIESVDGEAIEGVEEIDLNSYMNFFNSLAVLVEEKIVSPSDVMKLFRYQMEKTFASVEMIRYMEDFGFNRIKKILPKGFFFYGTLKNEKERLQNSDLKEVSHFLVNSRKMKFLNIRKMSFQFNLFRYKLEEIIISNERYKAVTLSKSIKDRVIGEFVEITDDSDWSLLFERLDSYEEVEEYYDRSIVKMNNSKQYCWVYLMRKK
jgi:gamma-glutamylcyclotransferase (GGCT)/AIG2-like uncharacterized protein YtfP